MSAKKKVNQSSPRSLATGERDCAAVCPGEADGERMGSARRAKRPPSNSKASVDSPHTPAPQGTDGVVIGRVPHASATPQYPGTPVDSPLRKRCRSSSIGLSMRKDGNFEKSSSNQTEFQNERGSWNFGVENGGTLRCQPREKFHRPFPEVLEPVSMRFDHDVMVPPAVPLPGGGLCVLGRLALVCRKALFLRREWPRIEPRTVFSTMFDHLRADSSLH